MNLPKRFAIALLLLGSLCNAAEQRIWRDATGAFSVQATFVDSADGQVRLRKADGSVIQVLVSGLSVEDQAFIRKMSLESGASVTGGDGSANGTRVWKDVTGEFSITAGLVGLSGGRVRLRKVDGTVIEVPLERLSVEDRKYLKNGPRVKPVSTETILEQNASVEFKNIALTDVVSHLNEEYHIPVVLDRRGLEDVGIRASTPITLSAIDKPLKEILDEFLDALDLVYRVEFELIVITTPESNERHQSARVYRIVRGAPWNDFDAAIRQIKQEITPNAWDSVGGHATVKAFMLDRIALLIVHHTYSAQREVEDHYRGLLEVARLAAPLTSKDMGVPEEMLQSCAWSLESVSLGDFVTFLHNSHDLDVELDEAALRDFGLNATTPLHAEISGMNVLNALNYVLSQLDLTWTVRKGDTIVITTPEQVELIPFAKTYLVGDLIGRDPTGRAADNLIDVITSIVSPATWHHVGGKGTITSDRRRTLSVTQTIRQHLQIATLLGHMRTARGN